MYGPQYPEPVEDTVSISLTGHSSTEGNAEEGKVDLNTTTVISILEVNLDPSHLKLGPVYV